MNQEEKVVDLKEKLEDMKGAVVANAGTTERVVIVVMAAIEEEVVSAEMIVVMEGVVGMVWSGKLEIEMVVRIQRGLVGQRMAKKTLAVRVKGEGKTSVGVMTIGEKGA